MALGLSHMCLQHSHPVRFEALAGLRLAKLSATSSMPEAVSLKRGLRKGHGCSRDRSPLLSLVKCGFLPLRFLKEASFLPGTRLGCGCYTRNSRMRAVSFFNLFGGGGAKKSVAAKEEDESEVRIAKYRNVPLPIPNSLLDATFLGGREIACCYRASEDGFSAADFHRHCDFKGPCFVVATSDQGIRFGGFSPEGFRSTDDYYDSLDAFLFFWPQGSSDPVVLPKVGGGGAALFDYARGGPQFGADGLLLGPPLTPVMGGFSGPDSNKGVGSLVEARSRLGLSYAKRPDGSDSLFGTERTATVIEVEVFCSPQIAALY